MGYDILILTDHSRHTAENSVYALASALASHSDVNSVDIASRGVEENQFFFDGNIEAVLSVIPAIPRLTYKKALLLFESSVTEAELMDYDFVLLRIPQPVPVKLFRALIQTIPEDHLINEPSGIIRTSSKAYLLEVADLCPPMRLVKKQSEVLAFSRLFPIVLKPLYGYAGEQIVKATTMYIEDGFGTRINHPTYFKKWSPPYLAMQFLPRVMEGDKRTLVVKGEIMGSALRKPSEGTWLCNIAQGGTSAHDIADKRERIIAEKLSNELSNHGIVMFGFDTLIGDDGHRLLTEINTMSVGGLKQIRDNQGHPVMKNIVRRLMQHLDSVWYGEKQA